MYYFVVCHTFIDLQLSYDRGLLKNVLYFDYFDELFFYKVFTDPRRGHKIFTILRIISRFLLNVGLTLAGRDSCLRAVLCYKDSIYKGLYGKQRFCFKSKKYIYFVNKVNLRTLIRCFILCCLPDSQVNTTTITRRTICDLRLRLITLTSTLIIPNITKTSSNKSAFTSKLVYQPITALQKLRIFVLTILKSIYPLCKYGFHTVCNFKWKLWRLITKAHLIRRIYCRPFNTKLFQLSIVCLFVLAELLCLLETHTGITFGIIGTNEHYLYTVIYKKSCSFCEHNFGM